MDVAPGDIVIDKYRYGAMSCPAGNLARALVLLDAAMAVITGTQVAANSDGRGVNLAALKADIAKLSK